MAWNPPRGIFGPQVVNTSFVTDAILPPLGTSIYLIANVDFTAGIFASIGISLEWSHDGGLHWGKGDPSTDYSFTVFGSDLSRIKRFPIGGTLYRLAFEVTGVGTSAMVSLSEYTTV